MARLPIEDALDLYGISHWGRGFFGISPDGSLTVRPTGDPAVEVSLPEVVAELRAAGHDTPFMFRFPQLLETRVRELTSAFALAMSEFDYDGSGYLPVFPIKVNHRRGVVEALLDAGRSARLGIEVGSRPELLLSLALDIPDGALTVVNGYKDRHTLALAGLGTRLGRRVVVVVEKLFEVERLIRAFADMPPEARPEIGLRARLSARGAGKWWKSSGATSKFGLSTTAMLESLERLERAGLLDRVAMLHFHVGSQIPEIRRLKTAMREGARIYAQLSKAGAPLTLLNVGGGLAVDYDGSRTASDASMNYSLQEYANDVVYTTREVCAEENVPFPSIVSESGRALTAYHAMLVTDVVDRIEADHAEPGLQTELSSDAPRSLQELVDIRRELCAKTYREAYHDAVEMRDELMTLFNVGILSLEQRALAEQLFWDVARQALRFAQRERVPMEEFIELERALNDKYITNFSVFQSAPDHWALEQLFPVVPLAHLTDPPRRRGSIVDVTCDSDGEINRYVDIKNVKEALDLPDPDLHPGEPFDLAVLLLGAYQDIMGDMHNLFGAPKDVYVIADAAEGVRVERVDPGHSAADVLEETGYEPKQLAARVAEELDKARHDGRLDGAAAKTHLALYRELLASGTYLSRDVPEEQRIDSGERLGVNAGETHSAPRRRPRPPVSAVSDDRAG